MVVEGDLTWVENTGHDVLQNRTLEPVISLASVTPVHSITMEIV